jgi:hypothetical protein
MSDVVEVMAKALKQDDKYWSGWRNTSVNILAAIDEAGYSVVPKKPTKAMIEAALAALSDVTIEEPKAAAWDALRAYRAMLAASQLKGETR